MGRSGRLLRHHQLAAQEVEMPNTTITEMDSVANDVRGILERLPKREKYDLSSPSGWQELLDSSISGRISEQLPRETLRQLRVLCLRWQRLYSKLQFEALTRPVWNT
jgi:hypothetical protein